MKQQNSAIYKGYANPASLPHAGCGQRAARFGHPWPKE